MKQILFFSLGIFLLNVLHAQNVGVGVSTPLYKLDVNGDINIAAGNYLKVNGVRVLKDNPAAGDNNVFVGDYADTAASPGFRNTAIGSYSMLMNTGAYNTAVGSTSLESNSTGSSNTAVGEKAMILNTTGGTNSAFGSGALQNNSTASNNVAVGFQALFYNNGSYNVGVGYQALFNNNAGYYNTACGHGSLGANTSGTYNTALGSFSLKDNTTGSYNVSIGEESMFGSITGSENTAVGYNAGTADGVTNSTAIGYRAGAGASNTIMLGNGNVTDVVSYGTFHQYSDARVKFNIHEDVPGLSFITKLVPVTYQLNVHLMNSNSIAGASFTSYTTSPGELSAMDIRRSGFIAQDVEKAAKETGYNFDAIHKPENKKDYYSLNYSGFVVPLVKAVQELSEENNLLKKQVDDITKKLKELADKIGK